MKAFLETLEEVNRIRAKIKARCMIYQVESKEDAARAFGRPLNHFYHWPYRHWSKVSRMLVHKRDRVMGECIALGIPMDMPFDQFPHYRKQMGLDK